VGVVGIVSTEHPAPSTQHPAPSTGTAQNIGNPAAQVPATNWAATRFGGPPGASSPKRPDSSNASNFQFPISIFVTPNQLQPSPATSSRLPLVQRLSPRKSIVLEIRSANCPDRSWPHSLDPPGPSQFPCLSGREIFTCSDCPAIIGTSSSLCEDQTNSLSPQHHHTQKLTSSGSPKSIIACDLKTPTGF
jgi:hypothetical protein